MRTAFAGDAVTSLLSILGEEDSVWTKEPKMWPSIVDGKIHVERVSVVDVQGLDPEDVLLTWGLVFPVLAQKLSFTAVQGAATLLAVHVLRSDVLWSLPKRLRAVWPELVGEP